MSPDSFDRHTRKWSERQLIEAGLDPLQRQRRAREAKLWVEPDTGLGVLMAKLPRPQFEHLRQAIDSHYLHLLRQDGDDGGDPDEVRTPKQRLADVVVELLGGRDSLTGEFMTGTVSVKAKASTQVILSGPDGRRGRDRPRRTREDDRGRSRTPIDPRDAHSRYRAGSHHLRPGRTSPLARTKPAPR